MQFRTDIELAKLAVRSKICPACYQRPARSEELGPSHARSCESRCTVFLSLPKLLSALEQMPLEAAPDGVMREVVCPSCKASATAGDFCVDGMVRTCPLSRYSGDVLRILEDLRRVALHNMQKSNH